MDKNKLLFSIGPLEMDNEILNMGSNKIPYFRTKEFSNINKDVCEKLKKVVQTNENSKVAILTASGTGAMEAAVINTFNESDKILIIVGGGFGRRFAEICDIHGFTYDVLMIEEDEELTEEHLNKYRNCGYTGLLTNAHETSICKFYDMKIIGKFCSEENIILVCDAISSFLADEYLMDQWKIDVTIISSQKGLALPPGISLIVVNERTYRKIMNNNVKSLYLNLKDCFINMERGQTPFTPAVSIINQLHYRLTKIIESGVQCEVDKTKELAIHFRNSIDNLPKKIPIYIPKRRLSNAATPVMFSSTISAYDVFERLKNENGIVVCPNGGEFSKKMFRVGHMGNLTIKDNDILISAMVNILKNKLH